MKPIAEICRCEIHYPCHILEAQLVFKIKLNIGKSLSYGDIKLVITAVSLVLSDNGYNYVFEQISYNCRLHFKGVLVLVEKKLGLGDESVKLLALKKGDKLLIMGDEAQGMAMVKLNSFLAATAEIMKIIKETDTDEEN